MMNWDFKRGKSMLRSLSPPPLLPLFLFVSSLFTVLIPQCLSVFERVLLGAGSFSQCDLMVLCFLFLFSLKDPCHFDVWAHPPIMAHRIRSGSKCFWSDLLLYWSCSFCHKPQLIQGVLISTTWQSLNHNVGVNMKLLKCNHVFIACIP